MAGAFDRIIQSVLQPGTGTDPNSSPEGAVLRDRFHQIRGSGHVGQLADGHVERLAGELITSRGAPMTPQNMQIALEYLQGGGLGKFEQQQATESAIADEAMAAETGGAGTSTRGPVSAPTPTDSAPPAVVTDAPSMQPIDDTGMPMMPIVPPVRRTGDPATEAPGSAGREVMVRAIDGQGNEGVVPRVLAERNGWRIVGVNVPQDPRLTAPEGMPELPYDPNVRAAPEGNGQSRIGTDVVDAEVIPDDPATPRQLSAPEVREVPTEDIVPTERPRGRPAGTTSVGGQTFEIYRDGTRYTATGPDGKEITGGSINAVKQILRRMF